MTNILQLIYGIIHSIVGDSYILPLTILVYFLTNLLIFKDDVDQLKQLRRKVFLYIAIIVILKLLLVFFGHAIMDYLLNNRFNDI